MQASARKGVVLKSMIWVRGAEPVGPEFPHGCTAGNYIDQIAYDCEFGGRNAYSNPYVPESHSAGVALAL